jgi:hypothetical protein
MPWSITSGTEPAVEGDDGRAAGHRLDHHQAEGLRPVDGEEQGLAPERNFGLLLLVDLADVTLSWPATRGAIFSSQ